MLRSSEGDLELHGLIAPKTVLFSALMRTSNVTPVVLFTAAAPHGDMFCNNQQDGSIHKTAVCTAVKRSNTGSHVASHTVQYTVS
jgi:hypothetical protein